MSIFPLGLSLNLEAEAERCGGLGDGWFRNPRREAATICGGRPGLFSLANDADRGEPSTGLDVRSGELRSAVPNL
jgi:hypothetical protein